MTNYAQEFLKLYAAPNLCRINSDGFITFGQWPRPGPDLGYFKPACKEVSKHYGRDIEVRWAHVSAEYDKGTEFEDNDGWYLFIRVPNRQEGKRLEQAIYDYFNCPGSYEEEDYF